MIKVEFLKDSAGVTAGTVIEWKDNHAGLVRQLEEQGIVRRIEPTPEREKIEKLPSKQVEKVESEKPLRKPYQRKKQ